jgi:Pyruvate kinase, alpha/beta domain
MTKYQGQRRFGTEHALPITWISRDPAKRVNETFAYHTTTMANTLSVPVLVFTSTGNMPALLSHYRPNGPIFAFTDNPVVRRRMALYHAVTALDCDFRKTTNDIVNGALAVCHSTHQVLSCCPAVCALVTGLVLPCFHAERNLQELKLRGLLESEDQVLVVQSSASSVWGFECPHAIMLYSIP